jgi:nucleotide-binding universal stress UspA family protein
VNSILTVGYDGSPPSTKAVLWAADEAARLAAGLRIVSCYWKPSSSDPWIAPDAFDFDVVAERTRGELDAVAQTVAEHHADLAVDTVAVYGDARTELVEHAEGSRLLVVGTTGAGAVRSFLLGSVSHAVAQHGPCPVVIVPDADPRAPSNRIVVGTDGSPAAAEAVAWAADEADLRNDELVVVHAWSYPYRIKSAESDGRDLTRVDAALLLEESVASCRERGREPVHGELVEDSPAAAILDVARDADLVVVGSRGRGGVRTLMFGSVAHAVTQHATCPTVIVRHGTAH